jgi:hypothetical protein
MQLKNTLSELQKPSFSIYFKEDLQITSCVYNSKFQSIVLGNSLGKVGNDYFNLILKLLFLTLNPDIRNVSENDSGHRIQYLKSEEKEVEEDSRVVNMIMEGNQLVVVTNKSIFSYQMTKWNILTR